MFEWLDHTDAGAIVFLCGSLLWCAACFALTWRDYRNGWKISAQTSAWLIIPLGMGAIGAFNAYNPYAGKPQITKTGVLIQKYQSIYPHHHWHGYGVLACVSDCTGDVPLLELNESAAPAWENAGTGRLYSVEYLALRKAVDTGDFAVTAHLVLRIDDTETGRSIYFVDTNQHWNRVALLALSAMACLATMIVCQRIAATNPDLDEQRSRVVSDDGQSRPEEVTSLDLESQDN